MVEKVTDVVVVGFGAAGSAAAIEAADAGVEVALLEKMRRPGGAAAMAGGVVYGAGTSVQRAAGVADTPDEMYKFFLATDDGLKDPALVRVLADKSAEAIEWLIGLGADFPPEGVFIAGAERRFAHVTPPKPRTHHFRALPGQSTKTGPRLFAVLEQAVQARKIEIMLQTAAVELVANSQKEVVGVKASSQGSELFIRARRAVVLADGGFIQNREMVMQYLNSGQHVATGRLALRSHPGQTGDGIRMAMALGADLCGMAWALARERPFIPVGQANFYDGRQRYPSIFVNRYGLRFVNEDRSYVVLNPAIDKQDFTAFQIFDDRAMKAATVSQTRSNLLVSAPTVGDLARQLGIAVEGLERTVERWNRHAREGEDPEFRRRGATVGPIDTPPYWGGELSRGLLVNYGGLKTNARTQVLEALHAKPIPRLYAAGQTTGGRLGAFYPGPGSALADCFVFGRIAGQNAAAEIPADCNTA